MVAVIQNVGRQAVTVRRCTWHSSTFSISERDAIGHEFPYRLPPDDECFSGIKPDLISTLYGAGEAGAGEQRIWPEVELGNGRTERGKPLVMPALGSEAPGQP